MTRARSRPSYEYIDAAGDGAIDAQTPELVRVQRGRIGVEHHQVGTLSRPQASDFLLESTGACRVDRVHLERLANADLLAIAKALACGRPALYGAAHTV
jgi:hypothetical protein